MIGKAELLAQLGNPATPKTVDRLYQFTHLPSSVIDRLSHEALTEEWGRDHFALKKYLPVHVAWSIEQEQFTFNEDQLVVAAGSLQTRYGTPLFLVFEPNNVPGRQPWALVYAGPRVSAPQLPLPPVIPPCPEITKGAEVVMMHDHILGDHPELVAFLQQTPPVAQMCAVSGAIQWSINRGLIVPYWYYGRMQCLVPLYLQSRENITVAPDLVAPLEVSPNNILVRTVLPPHAPYANARVAVRRHDQLPAWMLDCWHSEAERMTDEGNDHEVALVAPVPNGD
jgi:hypothetical protein